MVGYIMNNSDKEILIKTPEGVVRPFNGFPDLISLTNSIQTENIKTSVVLASVGKPTMRIFPSLIEQSIEYWKNLDLTKASSYGHPQGDLEYRERMAKTLATQYDGKFYPETIIFTPGGTPALHIINQFIEKEYPGRKGVLTVPTYMDHVGKRENIFIDIIKNTKDGKLTASLIEESLKNVTPDEIGAFIFCDPSNPMGTVTGADEWKKIADILNKFPEVPIVLDEAYAEMVYVEGGHVSFLKVINQNPDLLELKERIILMRSATKGMSAAGERMAILAMFNQEWMNSISSEHYDINIHTSKAGQYAFTGAMEKFVEQEKLEVAGYYKPSMDHIHQITAETGFSITNILPDHKIEGAFYMPVDFSKLIGMPIDVRTRDFVPSKSKNIEHDIDLYFHLIYKYGLALLPLSIFQVDAKAGLMRITCSFDKEKKDLILPNGKHLNSFYNSDSKVPGSNLKLSTIEALTPDEQFIHVALQTIANDLNLNKQQISL